VGPRVTQASSPPRPTIARRSPLRVVCGIDASSADRAAVREACRLAGPRGHVALVCIVTTGSLRSIASAPATVALERAMKQARSAGVRSSAYLVRNAHAIEGLLGAGATGDALVVGTHGHGRAAGIALGGVATHALHRATVPVLVARPPRDEAADSILLATDGSPSSSSACELAGRIAGAGGAVVTMFTAGEAVGGRSRHALAEQAVALTEATGSEPIATSGPGEPVGAIVATALSSGCSLLVLGSGGRTGVRALGSVSERVAHRAPCSVLVARPRTG